MHIKKEYSSGIILITSATIVMVSNSTSIISLNRVWYSNIERPYTLKDQSLPKAFKL